METDAEEFIKHHDIRFQDLDPKQHSIEQVVSLLAEVKGILKVEANSADSVHVRYDLQHITLQVIEDALIAVGFSLESSLVSRLKRALIYYTEETQLVNLGYHHDQANSTLDVFINVYNQRKHGCRDDRPAHLRQYS